MIKRFITYYLPLLLGAFLQATICFAENAEVTYTVWHGRRGTGEYANFTYQDASYVQVGVPTMEFEKTPPFVRTDLTQYTILSGQDGDATKVLFQYTPTKEFPLFYLYFAIEEYGGFYGHVYPYMSIHLYDGEDNVGCVFYNEFTEMGVQDGFIYDGVDSYVRYYRPWDVMVYDLSAYVGRTITIEMIATCCSNHHCWTHFYTAFEKARPADICGNCDNNVIVAPAYSNPIWRKGSSSGPIISDAEEMHITREMVDDYYCTLSTYCGPMTFLLGRALDVVPDFSYKTLCAEGKDTLFLSNKSYMKYRTSHAQVPCDTALWTFSDGQQSTQINVPYVIFSKAGKYTISLRTGSANFWCDSIITKEVPFGRQDYTDLVDSVCQEDLPYRWRGKEYRMSGDYTDTIPAQLTGCDSVLHLLLTVLDTTVSTTTYTICEGETITWNGKKYSAQGIYRDTLVNVAGCDSLLTLNIKYKSCSDEPTDHPLDPMPFLPIRDTLDTTICIGDTLMWHGIAYAHDTTARDTGYYSWYPLDSVYWVLELKTEVCCDTTYSTTDTIFLYDSLKLHPFMWFEKEYVEPGVYNDTLKGGSYMSCDSIGSLLLRVIYKDSVYACGDEQVTFHTPWGDYDSKPDCECLNGYPLQTLDGEWLVDATLCVNRLYTDTVREDTILCFGTSIEWNGITVDQTHEYEFHEPFQRLITCDSIVYILNAIIKDEPTDHPLTAAVCAGTSYTWTTYRDSLITAPGIYYDTLWTDHGCYSDTYVLTLTHNAHSTEDTTAYVCYGDLPYLWHGKSLTESCDTSWTTTNIAGCDSVVTLHLFVGPEPKSEHADTTICYGDMIDWHGQTISAEGTYYDTARVTMGNGQLCDSIWYELAVTIQKSDTTTNNISICTGGQYTWKRNGKPNRVISEAGEYWDTVRYVLTDCDSMIYHLTLQVEDINRDSTSQVTCAGTPYLWRGQSLTAEGVYRDTAKAKTVTECDTIYTLKLIIKAHSTGDTTAYVCYGDLPYLWHGKSLTESCDTSWTTTNVAGCDSVVTLHLFVSLEPKSEHADTTICYGDRIDWHGQTINAEGTFYDTARVTMGNGQLCDSIWYELAVTIQKSDTTTNNISICTGGQYTWKRNGKPDRVISEAGEYWDTVRYVLTDCDSMIYHLTLQVEDINRDSVSAETCANTPYLWRGQSLTAEGVYRDTAKAKTVTECDTVYTLRLTINQPTIGDTIVMACDSFTWHGVTYTESTDTATWTTTNIAGCDSIVTLHLTIHHASSSETNISICPEELPYTWNGKNYTAEGDYTYRTINAAGCDSTATLHLKVIQCCPDTIMRRTKLSICDTLMPYTWVTWREVVVEETGSFADTLRNDVGCDSIIYTLTLDTFHCCAPLMAAIDVPDYICADAPYLPIEVKLLSGECASYSLHFTNPALNKMPFRDTTITIDVQYASDEPFILDIPVPDDPDDSTHYVRPDDNYKVSLTLHDRCGNSIIFGDSIFSVYYPSWVTDQHWDDVIALLNDRYNGGYTFSSVQWLRDGEELAGEDGLYIYLPHELWTNPSHQYQSYFYQALLTRTDDGKTLPTCPLEPWHIDNTNVLSDPYVSVTPTLVPKENPVVHVMTNTEGTYWIYDPAGKLLQTADYEPCEHSAFDIRLYCVQTMYILVFTPKNEKKPLQHKYSVVKVLVE